MRTGEAGAYHPVLKQLRRDGDAGNGISCGCKTARGTICPGLLRMAIPPPLLAEIGGCRSLGLHFCVGFERARC